jgi:hypothetical protein
MTVVAPIHSNSDHSSHYANSNNHSHAAAAIHYRSHPKQKQIPDDVDVDGKSRSRLPPNEPKMIWNVGKWVRVVFAITVVIQLFILWIITQQHHHHSNRSPNDDRHYESGVGRFVASSSSASSIYKLAYDQSYGFFDDITEKDWKRHQQRARTAKSHRFPKDPLRFWYQPGWWYLNNYEPGMYECMNICI